MDLFNILKKFKKKNNDDEIHVISDNSNFNIIESYKAIRANINFTINKEGCKKIMICSSYSGEGKTTTCVNLAITIAQTGANVLLIDGDLRRSRIHKYFNIENDVGISNYLSNMVALEDVIKTTNIPYLNVITSGSQPPNPAELLSNGKMENLFAVCEEVVDYIIIDTPPICVVSDALPLSKYCDGVVLVVQHMETTHPSIKESLNKLEFAGANIAGMILNGIKINRNYKSYGKYNKYSYTYHSRNEKK